MCVTCAIAPAHAHVFIVWIPNNSNNGLSVRLFFLALSLSLSLLHSFMWMCFCAIFFVVFQWNFALLWILFRTNMLPPNIRAKYTIIIFIIVIRTSLFVGVSVHGKKTHPIPCYFPRIAAVRVQFRFWGVFFCSIFIFFIHYVDSSNNNNFGAWFVCLVCVHCALVCAYAKHEAITFFCHLFVLFMWLHLSLSRSLFLIKFFILVHLEFPISCSFVWYKLRTLLGNAPLWERKIHAYTVYTYTHERTHKTNITHPNSFT